MRSTRAAAPAPRASWRRSSARTWPSCAPSAARARSLAEDPVDRLYAARDGLTDALEASGPATDGVRRMLRLAIADDLRAAERLRGGGAT